MRYLFHLVAGLTLMSCASTSTPVSRRTAQTPPIPAESEATSIHSVYLTWQSPDTAHTMVINYVAFQQAGESRLFYGERETAKDVLQGPSHREIPGTPYHVYSFPLTGLKADTDYHFTISDDTNGTTKNYKFRTLPEDDSPLEIVVGGDMGAIGDIPDYARAVVTDRSRVILIGGDIAYDSGKLTNHKLWTKWFTLMNRSMVTPDGHILPLILAIGNHEAKDRRTKKGALDNVPFYFTLFHQNETIPYFENKLGSHTTLITLDSGHWAGHSGAQLRWLTETLEANRQTPNLLAMYHAPLYPSARDFNNSFSRLGRQHWQPVFDKYGLDMAFENHDHALKRTKMIQAGKAVDNNGTVYVGDGCWGQGARAINLKAKEYFEVLKNQRHLWRITLSSGAIHAVAIDKTGKVHDEFEVKNGRAATLQ